jgi:hypothetical protein
VLSFVQHYPSSASSAFVDLHNFLVTLTQYLGWEIHSYLTVLKKKYKVMHVSYVRKPKPAKDCSAAADDDDVSSSVVVLYNELQTTCYQELQTYRKSVTFQ